ncbi:MAG: MFS transporter [Chlorobiaceae bacterium]|nr:MFS transporter [Chlorobiaceae bacterium]
MQMNKSVIGRENGLAQVASVAVNVLAAFIQSVAMGMCAIIFPVFLEHNRISSSLIGMILAMDTIAAFVGALCLSACLKYFGMKSSLIVSVALSAMAIMGLSSVSGVMHWSLLVFANGFGSFMFIMLLQAWVSSLDLKKRKALMLALYSTVISVGMALGPVIVNAIEQSGFVARNLGQLVQASGLPLIFNQEMLTTRLGFYVASLVSGMSLVPIILGVFLVPNLQVKSQANIWNVISRAKGPMFALAMGAVSVYGVTSFITLYGNKNGLSVSDSALLLTFFLTGTLVLETPLAWISDYFDRRFVIVFACFATMVCAVYLPIAIYVNKIAWLLLFFWGGFTGCIYSTSMALISDRFQGDELLAANSGYSIMESAGGTVGILMIGFFMDLAGTDGLPYVIMFASILYFSFALTRYEVR